jgi:hypothetical protein
MSSKFENRSTYRALTTINAPQAVHIGPETLAACLRLECLDKKWRPHLRSFFDEVDTGTILDMVIEGTVTFQDLDRSIVCWEAGEGQNARWIREMAAVAMA